MNRHDRRALGKINKVKIVGTNVDHIKGAEQPYSLKTLLGYKK